MAAWMRGSRSEGTDTRDSWNPPPVRLEGRGEGEGRREGGEGEKSTQSTLASAVRRRGSVSWLQEEKTWVSSAVRMVRVWVQAGGGRGRGGGAPAGGRGPSRSGRGGRVART